jgi:hypothetical protein
VGNKYFMLTADIDFNGVNIDALPKATADFNGIFDGDGYALKDFVIIPVVDSANHNALFEDVGSSAVIKNLTITNASIVGDHTTGNTSAYCSIVVSELTYGAIIRNVTLNNCTVQFDHMQVDVGNNVHSYVGMIAGASHGYIEDCTVNGGTLKVEVSAVGFSIRAGGIAGYQGGWTTAGNVGWVKNSRSSALITTITGTGVDPEYSLEIGGLVGSLVASKIDGTSDYNLAILEDSTFTGVIDYVNSGSGHASVGGLVGRSHALVRRCHADATINVGYDTGTWKVGGAVGQLGIPAGTAVPKTTESSCVISNFTITDAGAEYVGGFVGNSWHDTEDCYSIVKRFRVNGGNDPSTLSTLGGYDGYANGSTHTNCFAVFSYVDPLVGHREGFVGFDLGDTIVNCYFDSTVFGSTTTSGAAVSGTATASSTTQLQTVNYAGLGGNWKQSSGQYPILKWQTYPLCSDEAQFGTGDYPIPTEDCVAPPFMDSNADCKVDFIDFCEFASEWMSCGLVNQIDCWE